MRDYNDVIYWVLIFQLTRVAKTKIEPSPCNSSSSSVIYGNKIP